ncbi:hypothetical protein J2X69_002138 [Algoriphagus sp. 4150]|uniref:hypothetical protein n=1 Tax=Algoriphagus sp. 4150 TaxID=2817756 RepID=UPI002855F774|nr:hypothetical protein [Algoriphagus sp. 4150]MDR7129792.1 hypothetical protein [Algoriphagus sp. 4150]
MKMTIILLLVALVIGACRSENGALSNKNEIIESFPVLLDTTNSDGFNLSKEIEYSTWLTTAHYGIYHIGLIRDTLYLNPFIGSPLPPIPEGGNQQDDTNYEMAALPFEKYYIDWLEEVDYTYAEDAEIQIRIDNSKSIYNAYPVWLTNLDTDTTLIGYGRHLPLFMEAIDSIGNWKPIQEPFVYFCGVGLNSIFLPPNESVLTLAPIFKGNFKTKLRVSLGDNHSEEFEGYINYRQFESIFNEDGQYKLAYKRELKE